MINEVIRDEVKRFTDTPGWSASWHWDRDHNGRLTLEGAKKMLKDLGCDGCEGSEILQAVHSIRRRYELADYIRCKIGIEEQRILKDAENPS